MTASAADAGSRARGATPAPGPRSSAGPGRPPAGVAEAWRPAGACAALAAAGHAAVAALAPAGISPAARVVGIVAPLVVLAVALAPALAARRRGVADRSTPSTGSTSAPAAGSAAPTDLAPLVALGALGSLGVGRLLVDLTLLLDPTAAARPELMADGTTPLPAGLAALLLVADLLLVTAGGLAVRGVLRARATGPASFGRHRAGALVRPVGGALLAGVGLLAAPFTVDGGATRFAPHAVLDTAAPAGLGVAVLAATVVLVAAWPAALVAAADDAAPGPIRPGAPASAARGSGPDDRVDDRGGDATGTRLRRAVHLTLGTAVVATVGPVLAASLARDGLAPSPGAALVVLGGLVLVGVPVRTALLRSRAAGVVALATAGAALVGALAPTLAAAGAAAPAIDDAPVVTGTGVLLLPAAVVLAVPAVLVVVGTPRLVVRARPTLSVAWLTVPFAAGPALDVVLAAVDAPRRADALPGLEGVVLPVPADEVVVGPGGWAVVAALVLAVLTAVVAVGAGFAERRDVAGAWAPPGSPLGARPADGTDTVEPDPIMLPLCALAAVLAVPGFGGPLARDALAANAGGTWQNPGAAAWGALAGVVGVAIAALLAPRARPARALALLGAAGALLVVRLSALVLTPPRPGESVGMGTYAAIACLVVTLGAAGVAVLRLREAAGERSARARGRDRRPTA